MPATEPLPRRGSKAETGALRIFGDNVRSRREAQDLSQEQLAERADLDRTYIGGLSRDKLYPLAKSEGSKLV